MADNRTLWEEGRYPGRLVGFAAAAAALLVVMFNLVGAGRIGLFFDLCFILICVTAALAIRPSEFFVAGVLPPLLLAGTISVLAVLDRSSVADDGDGLFQGVVTGLASHATALAVGYGLTLVVLAIRQIALRNHGRLRSAAPLRFPQQRSRPPAMPRQRTGSAEVRGRHVV